MAALSSHMALLPAFGLFTALLPSAFAILGSRTELVGGRRVNFTWSRADHNSGANFSAAADFCRHLQPAGRLPWASELRYFFKTLPTRSSTTFYLGDVLESTMDHPDQRIGERLCLIVAKSARAENAVKLLEDDARASCSKVTSVVVCGQEISEDLTTTTSTPSTTQSTTPVVARSVASQKVCLDSDLFYGILSSAGAILVILTLLSAGLAAYGWRQSRANSATAEAHVLGTLSRSSSKRSSYRSYRGAPGPSIMAADYLSRHQAAAIGNHLQREPSTKVAQASMLL